MKKSKASKPKPRASASKAQAAASPTPDAEVEPSAPPKAPALKLPELLAGLEEAAKALHVRVTYEAIGGELGAGGLCKVKGQWRVIIDKRTTPSERVQVLAPALARFPFAELQLAEPLRELLTRVAPPPPAPPSPPSPP
jgi:hypothetical protein